MDKRGGELSEEGKGRWIEGKSGMGEGKGGKEGKEGEEGV